MYGRKQCFAWRGLATLQNPCGLEFLDFIIYTPPPTHLNSSSGDPWRCGEEGREEEARHGWNHLTYSDGIKGRVAIFRSLGFGASFLGSVGVPGLKVSEQLSWELDSHRAPLGLPCMGKKRERTHSGWRGVVEVSRSPPWFLSSSSDMKGRGGEQG